jgi:hypothetical protein
MTPAGNRAVNRYFGDLCFRSLLSWTIPFDYVFSDQPFAEMFNKNPSFDILLGMDILSKGLFVTHGGLKQASFCW